MTELLTRRKAIWALAIACGATFATLPCTWLAAETVFFDDFTDGSATDGVPASWAVIWGGTLFVEDESLVINVPGAKIATGSVISPQQTFADVSIRTQARLIDGESIGLAARHVPNLISYGGYIQHETAAVYIGGNSQAVLDEAAVGLDAASEDIMMQLDAIGDTLSLWVWPVGEARPDDPVASTELEMEPEGRVSVWAHRTDGGDTEVKAAFRFIHVSTTHIPDIPTGDFDFNGQLDLPDINLLTTESASRQNPKRLDLTNDDLVNKDDIEFWIKDLYGSCPGDANLDREFDSADLVKVLEAGKYESQQAAVWEMGDWTGDGFFDTNDFVTALIAGCYEQGPVQRPVAVPEPTGMILFLLGTTLYFRRQNDRLHLYGKRKTSSSDSRHSQPQDVVRHFV